MRESGDCVAELPRDPRRLGGVLYDLTFVNVTTNDAKVIQCNISNKHGYNFTNAYINVYSEDHLIFTALLTLLLSLPDSIMLTPFYMASQLNTSLVSSAHKIPLHVLLLTGTGFTDSSSLLMFAHVLLSQHSVNI